MYIKVRLYVLCSVTIIVCVFLLVSNNKHSRGETSPGVKEFFSVKNEAYGITQRPDHQSSIEVTENVAYSTVEQEQAFKTPPVYETINEDIDENTGVYDNIIEFI